MKFLPIKILMVTAVALPLISQAQQPVLNTGGTLSGGIESNTAWYNRYDKKFQYASEKRLASNNYLKLEYRQGKFIAGAQYEFYRPQALLGYNDRWDASYGLATYYATFQSEKFEATIGSFYDQFGNGLVYRSWEDRQLGLNNATFGARVIYRPNDEITFKAIRGKTRDYFGKSDGLITGVDAEVGLNKMLNIKSKFNYSVGSSILVRTELGHALDEDNNPSRNTVAESVRLSMSGNKFSINGEYAHKGRDAMYVSAIDQVLYYSEHPDGNAYLLNATYSGKRVGTNITLRKMRNMEFRASRISQGTDQLLNYLPALTPQHHYALQNIYAYAARGTYSFGDATSQKKIVNVGEIGGQADVYINFPKKSKLGGKYGMKLSLNASQYYGLDFRHPHPPKADFEQGAYLDKLNYKEFTPGSLLYRDMGFELEKTFSKSFKGILTYSYINWKGGIIQAGDPFADYTIANFVALDGLYKIDKKHSVQLDVQHLWAARDFQGRGNWAAATAEVNFAPLLSVYVSDQWNYDNDIKDSRIHYYTAGTAATYKTARLSVAYGRQRDGLLCVGGVCRLVPKSSGFTASFNYSF